MATPSTLIIMAGVGLVLTLIDLGSGRTDQPAKTVERPVAIVGEKVIGWSELTPLLAEAAGGQVLEEYALGETLKQECSKRGITIGEPEIRAERRLLGEMLARAARLPADEGEGLINNIRRTRGLGELRFKGLLERNAALRAMVRAGIGDAPVAITPEDIDTAYELKHGPRLRARLILVRSDKDAQQVKVRLNAGISFADIAVEMSVDPSSIRGGLLDSFSPSDSTYPVAVRKALLDSKPGQISDPIAVSWEDQTGFAIVKLEENLPAPAEAPTKEAAAKNLEQEVRTVRERAQMDKLARKLMRTAGVTVMDSSLGWSWEGREGGK
jgi:hypothetical protein